jgi:hypothetical protein
MKPLFKPFERDTQNKPRWAHYAYNVDALAHIGTNSGGDHC